MTMVSALAWRPCSAQAPRHLGTVHDGGGVVSTSRVDLGGVPYRHVGAVAQPGGVSTQANGSLRHGAGFLQAVDIKKWNQAGPNGPHELTEDNDGDGLGDAAEVGGTGWPDNPGTFTDPNDPDTDHDTVNDREESAAGSNPNDPGSLFEITDLRRENDGTVVRFSARGDGRQRYRILADDGPYDNPSEALTTSVYTGGSAPWYETTAGYTNAGTASLRAYAVEALP